MNRPIFISNKRASGALDHSPGSVLAYEMFKIINILKEGILGGHLCESILYLAQWIWRRWYLKGHLRTGGNFAQHSRTILKAIKNATGTSVIFPINSSLIHFVFVLTSVLNVGERFTKI